MATKHKLVVPLIIDVLRGELVWDKFAYLGTKCDEVHYTYAKFYNDFSSSKSSPSRVLDTPLPPYEELCDPYSEEGEPSQKWKPHLRPATVLQGYTARWIHCMPLMKAWGIQPYCVRKPRVGRSCKVRKQWHEKNWMCACICCWPDSLQKIMLVPKCISGPNAGNEPRGVYVS